METEQRLWARRMLSRGLDKRGESSQVTPTKRGRVGSVVLDALALALGLVLGLAALHGITGDEGCQSCVVLSR